ncbi:unnamed protein product [Withania somnifera]
MIFHFEVRNILEISDGCFRLPNGLQSDVVSWRKLFVIGTILTVFRVIFQIYSLPNPLTKWIISPPLYVSSYQRLINHGNNSRELHKHLPTVVSLNSTAITNRSMKVQARRERLLRRRRQKDARLEEHIIYPPPPVVPDHLRIEKAPLVTYDPDLHVPLFRNISIFKRSYGLMELLLKVYIYKKERNLFSMNLMGIYSSEGWDPEKAHLFYLPYNSRQPLSTFLRVYVNMLAAKYSFWNRTHGTDHFIVACHDRGPYILKEHEELIRNTIKALCNADISDGIFKAGKDVSLPEIAIRNVQCHNAQSSAFAGNMHGAVRPKLLKYWSDKDEDMKIYGPLPNRISRKMSYPEHMKSSKYCLCPLGFKVNSPRIVEAIYYELLDWNAFSLIVAEKDIPKLKEILSSIPLRCYQVMPKYQELRVLRLYGALLHRDAKLHMHTTAKGEKILGG